MTSVEFRTTHRKKIIRRNLYKKLIKLVAKGSEDEQVQAWNKIWVVFIFNSGWLTFGMPSSSPACWTLSWCRCLPSCTPQQLGRPLNSFSGVGTRNPSDLEKWPFPLPSCASMKEWISYQQQHKGRLSVNYTFSNAPGSDNRHSLNPQRWWWCKFIVSAGWHFLGGEKKPATNESVHDVKSCWANNFEEKFISWRPFCSDAFRTDLSWNFALKQYII